MCVCVCVCVYVCVCVCVCVSVYTTFSVSADGHLGCCVVSAVVGNAAVNVGMQAFL